MAVLHGPNTACEKLANKGNPGVGDKEGEVIVEGGSQNQHPSTATAARESR